MMHERCMRKSSEEEYEEKEEGEKGKIRVRRMSKREDTLIVLSCREVLAGLEGDERTERERDGVIDGIRWIDASESSCH